MRGRNAKLRKIDYICIAVRGLEKVRRISEEDQGRCAVLEDSSGATLKEEKMAEHQEWDKERAEQHARWAKMASRLSYAPFAKKIVESLARLESGATIVDLGTGPGILSIELHKLLPQAKIIGVDLSSDMLEIARKNADEAGMSNYETRLGRAEEIPIESNSVNLVITQSSFHEWEDQRKGLSEIFRILRPGGSLILKDYNWDWLSGWRRSLLKFLLTMVGESYEDHIGMFKFTFDEVADLLREAGFDEIKGKVRGLQFSVQAVKRQKTDSEAGMKKPTEKEGEFRGTVGVEQ